MCFNKPKKQKQQSQIIPAQAVAAQPVTSGSNVKSSIKQEDKERGSGADLRTGLGEDTGGGVPPNVPSPGGVPLTSGKKRKKIVGLDL